MTLRAYIAGIVLCVAAASADAAPVAYGESLGTYNKVSQSALYRIDLATRVATLVGPSGAGPVGPVNGLYPFNVRGLSFDPQGQLYAVSEDTETLLQVNRLNGAVTPVGALKLSGPGVPTAQFLDLSMAITCDGKAWLASAGTGNFWQVNTSTGATTLIGSTGGTITGLAANGNTLYATGSRGDASLYTINTANAKLVAVGAYGGTTGAVRTISPSFDSTGQLWAILDNIPGYPSSSAANEQWSNLAQIGGNGAMNKLGAITGPAALDSEGLVGLAISPPTCATTGGAGPGDEIHAAPTTSWLGLWILALLLIAFAARNTVPKP
ncbi:MAG: hypothetical protein ABI846_03295 [Rudaea sp.]